MFRSFVLGAALATAPAVAGAQSAASGSILAAENVSLPPYSEARDVMRAVPLDDYERARRDTGFQMVRLTYASDSLPVVAFIYKPSAVAGKQPVIIYNRGGYVRQNIAPELLVPFYRLARAGFVVVAPMYRGSEGAPGHDEMGGADLSDLLNIQPVIATLPYADPSSVFLYGESRGGMMTLQALREGFPARAAAVFGAFTDLEEYLKADERAAAAASQIWPDYEKSRAAILERRSALRWAERIGAPLLIMHGGDDRTVSPTHALQLAGALQRHARPYELWIAAGARHVLQPFEADRDERAVRWFRRHMP